MNPTPPSTDLHELKSITEALVNLLIEELDQAKQSFIITKSALSNLTTTLTQKKSFLSFLQDSISRCERPLLQELHLLNTKIQSYKCLISYSQNLIESYTVSSIPNGKTPYPITAPSKKAPNSINQPS